MREWISLHELEELTDQPRSTLAMWAKEDYFGPVALDLSRRGRPYRFTPVDAVVACVVAAAADYVRSGVYLKQMGHFARARAAGITPVPDGSVLIIRRGSRAMGRRLGAEGGLVYTAEWLSESERKSATWALEFLGLSYAVVPYHSIVERIRGWFEQPSSGEGKE